MGCCIMGSGRLMVAEFGRLAFAVFFFTTKLLYSSLNCFKSTIFLIQYRVAELAELTRLVVKLVTARRLLVKLATASD